MGDLVKEARSAAKSLEVRERVRNGSDDASELRQSPEYRAAKILLLIADENERLRYVLGGVRGAIKTGRNEPLQVWLDQINIALDERMSPPAPEPAD